MERSCEHGIESEARELLVEIMRCSSVVAASGDSTHPCAEIVAFQDRFGPDHVFQPPTPWIGHLDLAPILFLGSNPNIGGAELYPDMTWADDEIVDFFDAAFDGHTGQIVDGTKAARADGTYGNTVRTWAAARSRAKELLGRDVEAGVDYAMAEIVHCRSWDEIGVDSARSHCTDLYLDRVIAASGAKVLVAFGAHNRRWFSDRYELPEGNLHEIDSRLLAFLPHPTSWQKKTFGTVYTTAEISSLRTALTGAHG